MKVLITLLKKLAFKRDTSNVETARIQYVFLDVVSFTKDRSIEAQSEIVAVLNKVVLQGLHCLGISKADTILIPTGDGIAIAMIKVQGVDLHLRLALEILSLINEHNLKVSDAMRHFEVRIGINENIDNIITDINGVRNVAGAGISMAQRIMDNADGGNILIGTSVYETLKQRQQYISSFRDYLAKGKHGISYPVYQFISSDCPGLNVSTPSAFTKKESKPEKLTKFMAYYIAHAVLNRGFLESKKGDIKHTAVVLLYFLAHDSITASKTSSYDEIAPKTWRAGKASFEEQYEHYNNFDYYVICDLSEMIQEKYLQRYSNYFEGDLWMHFYTFVKQSGIDKLKIDWPQIFEEFKLESLQK